jgi:hypothetical protein
MQALGFQNEECPDCKRQFQRGQTIYAVVEEDGNPIGWFCKACIDGYEARSSANVQI